MRIRAAVAGGLVLAGSFVAACTPTPDPTGPSQEVLACRVERREIITAYHAVAATLLADPSSTVTVFDFLTEPPVYFVVTGSPSGVLRTATNVVTMVDCPAIAAVELA